MCIFVNTKTKKQCTRMEKEDCNGYCLYHFNKLPNKNDYDSINISSGDARNQVALDKYYAFSSLFNKKSRVGLLECKYYQNDNGLFGRYQAKGSLSGQGMVREVRHTIFDEYYVDIDIDNAHPIITQWLCTNLKIDCTLLSQYIGNREAIFRDLMALNPSKSREHFKKAFLKMSYGCGEKAYEALFDVKNDFVVDFRREIKSIQQQISEVFKKFYNLACGLL